MKLPNLKLGVNLANLLQPILTIILIGLIVLFASKYFPKSDSNKDGVLREVSKKITFDAAANKFLTGNYQAYTRGTLILKDQSVTPTPDLQSSNKKTIAAVENKYNDLFFYTKNGEVKRVDIKTYGQNETVFFDDKGELVYLSNIDKSYTVYPIPDDSETQIKLFFGASKQLLESTFPLSPLLKDYKEGKFNPIERSTNLYSGKWQHPIFTNNEVLDVIIETDPTSGLFRSFNVVLNFSDTPSQIYFDFSEYGENFDNLTVLPQSYKKLPLPKEYKVKQ